jgi:large subunit ribosomal protein L4
MTADLYDISGKKAGSIEVSDAIFSRAWNADLVHQAVLAQLANLRRPWAHAKGRGEVRGGGIKPWKQKGTGRARHGSIRSPIWKGGGASHGPVKTRSFEQKVNKKMARQALHAVLSRKLAEGELKFIVAVPAEKGKTKEVFSALKGFFSAKRQLPSTLLVSATKNGALVRAARNIDRVQVLPGGSLNIADVLNAKNVLVEQGAVIEIK